MRFLAILAPLLLVPVARAAPAVRAPERPSAAPQVTKEEALRLAFPGCELEERVLYLTKAERARVEELAGFDPETGVVRVHVATREGKLVGHGWFDVHTVRTKKEALLLVVDPGERLRRIEVLAFLEPPEYRPRGSWYAQFLGRGLDEELRLGAGIKGVTGATLTARATLRAARRVLALHRVGVVERAGPSRP